MMTLRISRTDGREAEYVLRAGIAEFAGAVPADWTRRCALGVYNSAVAEFGDALAGPGKAVIMFRELNPAGR